MADTDRHLAPVLRALRALAKDLPGAEEYVMVHHPAFRVGKKPFAVAGMNQSATLSINLGKDAQGELLGDERFVKTPYMGHHGWVTAELSDLRDDEVEMLVTESWRRVARKRDLAAYDAD